MRRGPHELILGTLRCPIASVSTAQAPARRILPHGQDGRKIERFILTACRRTAAAWWLVPASKTGEDPMGKIIDMRERQRRQGNGSGMKWLISGFRQGVEMIEDIDRRTEPRRKAPRPWWRFW